MSEVLGNPQHTFLADMMADGAIDSARLAYALSINKGQLAVAVGVGADTLRKRDRERRSTTQSRLKDVVEILNRVEPWCGSIPQAYAWYRSQPLPSFGGQTAEDLVKAGRGEAVKSYLSRIAVGGYA